MKPILKILVGLPASGKSTYSKQLDGYKIHSSDELRKEFYGDVNTFNKNGELFNELHRRIKKDLESGFNVCYDATNINRKNRISFLNTIKKIDCVRDAVILATPYNMCVQADKLRDKKVGYQVIKNMYFSFQVPMIQEGFDSIEIFYNPLINWEDDEYNFGKELSILTQINQMNEHHRLSIGDHCVKVGLLLSGIKDIPDTLKFSGFLHDFGKKKTMSFLNSKGEFSKYGHFYSHEAVSAYDSLFYVAQSNLSYKSPNDTLAIVTYISEHMKPHLLKDKALDKYKKFVGEEFWNHLEIFNKADTEAKS